MLAQRQHRMAAQPETVSQAMQRFGASLGAGS